MLKKRILSLILSMALVFGLMGQTGVAFAADSTNSYYSNAKTMSANGEYPTADGKVFAGWYQDETLKYRVRYEDEFVNGGAYAKFVDEDVLSVKAQLRTDVTKDTASTELRLLTSVDSLVYESVGFDITVGGKTIETLSSTVWETVNANENGTLKSYAAKDVFDNDDSKYIMPFTLNNIPNGAFGTEITVTPKWVTMEGTVVYGITRSIIIYNHLPSYDTAGDYGTVWYAPSTTKVARSSTSSTNDANLHYQAVRNEYESAQLIISATKNINSFELYPADLFNGNKTLSAENVDIYVQKYVPISDDTRENTDGTTNSYGYGTGYMPDALIPMKAAAKYGENKIATGNNGGLWITIYIPKGTAAGTYTGTFALSINDGEKVVDIPVSVEVMDYTLPDEVDAKTLFSWRYDRVAAGELDGSLEMMETYYEFFQDYRISLQSLPLGTLSGEEMVEKVNKYYDTMTTYTILSDVGDISTNLPYRLDKMKEQILALAAASNSERNLLDKAVLYYIDEPHDSATIAAAKTNIANVNAALDECVSEIQTSLDNGETTYQAFKAIAPGNWASIIKDIPNVVTITDADTYLDDELLSNMNCVCLLFDHFDPDTVNAYKSMVGDRELWWYGCSSPGNPQPSYHIGDTNLLSARSVSWMQYKYGIVGNLYWDAAAYTDEADEFYNEYNNVYENPYHRTYTNWPAGDGFLTYPGAAYGVYGPLPSMRLMSIRDGMEEYEMLEDVKAKYEAKKSSFGITDVDATMEALFYQTLYYDVQGEYKFFQGYKEEDSMAMNAHGYGGLDFANVRKNLLKMAENIDKGLGYAMSIQREYKKETLGDALKSTSKVTYTCYVENGATLKIDGATVTSGQSVSKSSPATNAAISIEVTNAGESATYTQYIGDNISAAKATVTKLNDAVTAPYIEEQDREYSDENGDYYVLQSFDTYEWITQSGLRVSKLFGASIVNTDAQYISRGAGSWKVQPEGDYGIANEYPYVRMRFDADNALGGSDVLPGFEKLLLDVYNTGEEDVYIQISLTAYDTLLGEYVEIPEAGLGRLKAKAWSTCEYDLSDYWVFFDDMRYDLEYVKYITITFLDKKENADDTCAPIYIDNLRGLYYDGAVEYEKSSLSTGIHGDYLSDVFLFTNEAGDSTPILSRVQYAGTPLADATSILGLGDYGFRRDATANNYPDFTIKLGDTYTAGTKVKFWMYVAADEGITSTDTFRAEAYNHRGGTEYLNQSGYQFNHWIEVTLELKGDTDQFWFFANFDHLSELYGEEVTIYLDEFQIMEEDTGIWGPIL